MNVGACFSPIARQSSKARQELIVEINIGKVSQVKQIRIVDINKINLIDQEIKWFIRLHNLKDTAFHFIKQKIQTEIANKRNQIYRQSHKKHSDHCKCSQKLQNFEQKEKKMTQILSFNQSPSTKSPKRTSISPNKTSNSPHPPPLAESKKKPLHLQIKINSKSISSSKANSKQNSQFKLYQITDNSFFNSKLQFPSLRQIEKASFGDQTFSDAFASNNVKDSCEFTNVTQYESNQKKSINCHLVMIRSENKDNLIKPLQTSFKKNQPNPIVIRNPPGKRQSVSPNLASNSASKARLSTKDMKMAIMTPKHRQRDDENFDRERVYHGVDHESLQRFISQQKKALRQQYNSHLLKVINNEPLFTQNCISYAFEKTLKQLFSKLTSKNPPQMQQLHTKYVSYQHLQKQQLHFMGILFQKINYKQLNNLNYANFRSNSLKYCWGQLEELIAQRQNKMMGQMMSSARYLTRQFVD